jgi:hypothetical protein
MKMDDGHFGIPFVGKEVELAKIVEYYWDKMGRKWTNVADFED